MALKSISNEVGDIVVNDNGELDPEGDWCVESLEDPARDRLLVHGLRLEAQLRDVQRELTRVSHVVDGARALFWFVFAVVLLLRLIDYLRS